MRIIALLCPAFAAVFLAALGGCQVAQPQFPTPSAGWQTSIGQLQYATRKRSVIGEAVVSRQGATDFQLDFTAGPGLPLMKLREAGTLGRAEGVIAHGTWQGEPSRAIGTVGTWMRLREAFAAIDAARTAGGSKRVSAVSPAGRRGWVAQAFGNQPERIQVQFPGSGERFVFVFSK